MQGHEEGVSEYYEVATGLHEGTKFLTRYEEKSMTVDMIVASRPVDNYRIVYPGWSVTAEEVIVMI